jgi:hypothetical protein
MFRTIYYLTITQGLSNLKFHIHIINLLKTAIYKEKLVGM